MEKIFIIGGMGAGKSTVRKALVDEGVAYIDLDQVGHDVLTWDTVKTDLVAAFGVDILNPNGEINRAALARKAFVNPETTRRLNRLTLPRIEDAYTTQVEKLKEEGEEAVVVENSIFRSKKRSMAYDADIIIAVVAPIELRIQRAVASGWAEDDVRRRIAQQITDAERIQRSDVVFNNDGTREELWDQVVEWWHEHQAERAREKAESAEEADDEAEDANQ